MNNVLKLLERQAKRQKCQQVLSWPEKLRRAAAVRRSIQKLKEAKNTNQRG